MTKPVILWIRRELRLADNPALAAACESGRAVIPVVIRDAAMRRLGAAPQWRLGLGLEHFARELSGRGGRLIFRTGEPDTVLPALLRETGATAVYWTRAYDAPSVARDTRLKSTLRSAGHRVQSFSGNLLFEPWTVETGQGGHYRVFTPFWKAVRNRTVPAALRPPSRIAVPDRWPLSEPLQEWKLGAGMSRGASVVARHACVGEAKARERLETFVENRLADYPKSRDVLGIRGTSNLSEPLALGEIAAAACWRAGWAALQDGNPGAETFLRELAWREFAYHLMYHTPQLLTGCWREEWEAFPWNPDRDRPEVRAWQLGRTGIELVDAAMREMYVTGRTHNRGRMIVASFLSKHLMADWRIGRDWFADCLIDWDPASNALGWQWAAGCGPDAAPYFRVFNPDTQAEKFDRERTYRNRWLAERVSAPGPEALSYFEAVPQSLGLNPVAPYPEPVVSLSEGRARALAAYNNRPFRPETEGAKS